MDEQYIPASTLSMAIIMVNAAEQCDQAGQWDRDHRRACKHILEWINSNDYKITCQKAHAQAARPDVHAFWRPTKLKGYYECTNCRADNTTNPKQHFCSFCGAKMDGKFTLGSEANGCWMSCAECANTGCKNRYVQEAQEDDKR